MIIQDHLSSVCRLSPETGNGTQTSMKYIRGQYKNKYTYCGLNVEGVVDLHWTTKWKFMFAMVTENIRTIFMNNLRSHYNTVKFI